MEVTRRGASRPVTEPVSFRREPEPHRESGCADHCARRQRLSPDSSRGGAGAIEPVGQHRVDERAFEETVQGAGGLNRILKAGRGRASSAAPLP